MKKDTMNWQDYQMEWEFDGSWKDIYVLQSSVSDWQKLIDFFRSGIYPYRFSFEGERAVFPLYAEELFESERRNKSYLMLEVEDVILNCHFFDEDNIEFDFDPREIRSETQAEQVFEFMRRIGRLLHKEVVLTPENAPNLTTFKFFPDTGKIQYFPIEN